ncbi:hypothetical protein [Halochromatium sp.]
MTTLTMAVVAFGLAQGAAAADLKGKWEALSNTATSITGDIQVADDAIMFGDGTRLAMSAEGSVTGHWGDQQGPVEGAIYRLELPADPTLLHGNRFCGLPDNKVSYVVLAPFDEGLSLLVYTGDAKPMPDASPCAIYNYAR